MTAGKKILVFGQSGQVATELATLEPDAIFLSRKEAELTDPAAVTVALERVGDISAIINAAAFTAVDQAEAEPDLVQTVNATSVGVIAEHAAALNIPFVQISTDYVFDGSGVIPRGPDAATGPLGIYGASKLAGEEAVRAAGGIHAILRTSWVFSAHGSNFLKTMLRLSEDRTELSIVADQIGGPTPAADIAQACLTLVEGLTTAPEKTGTYHFTGAPDVSWADFAREIFAVSGRQVEVHDILTVAYPTPATRPLNSRLDCSTLEQQFGIARPDWQAATRAIVGRLT
ncbi:MAG: dTDP-4-dehydrorhamnose reductase [Roseobacter sp.]|nr:dTDP-4-dehydrorhamnose reductase [Roseobacter sp.]